MTFPRDKFEIGINVVIVTIIFTFSKLPTEVSTQKIQLIKVR